MTSHSETKGYVNQKRFRTAALKGRKQRDFENRMLRRIFGHKRGEETRG
jgi:hypothetical protein